MSIKIPFFNPTRLLQSDLFLVSPTRDLLTIDQLATKLQRSPGTIYYWVSRREIPFEKHGRALRFDYEKVRAHFQKTTQELNESCVDLITKLSKGSSLKTKDTKPSPSQKKEGVSYGNC